MNTALKYAQERWDNALPPDDDGDREYVTAQVGKLLNCEDGDCVPFHDKRQRAFSGPDFTVYGFAGFVPEWLAEVDSKECPMTQLLLAVRRGDLELAQRIWFRAFEATLIENVERLVRRDAHDHHHRPDQGRPSPDLRRLFVGSVFMFAVAFVEVAGL